MKSDFQKKSVSNKRLVAVGKLIPEEKKEMSQKNKDKLANRIASFLSTDNKPAKVYILDKDEKKSKKKRLMAKKSRKINAEIAKKVFRPTGSKKRK